MARNTPKIATFFFVPLMKLVCNPSIKVCLHRAFFCSFLPHLSLGWACCIPMAIGAPTAASKQPEILLGSLHFALSALWCLCETLPWKYLYLECFFLHNSTESIEFDDVYSCDIENVRRVMAHINAIWNTKTAHGSMRNWLNKFSIEFVILNSLCIFLLHCLPLLQNTL